MLDLAPLHEKLRSEIDRAIADVIDSNAFVLGRYVSDFEDAVAARLGVRHAVGVASGSDALLLSLKAAGIGAGDEVIVPAFTFFGSVEAILHAGATPVFADIEPGSMMLDPSGIDALITARTRAIVVVHLYGGMADIPALTETATRRGITLIEDAAQAFGAALEHKAAGSFGSAGCFSFHPTKPLGGFGDGGLVVTNDDDIAASLRGLRDHGARSRYRHVTVGYNSRLDALQAAVLRVKLRYLDDHLAERNRLAGRYDDLLRDLPLELPAIATGVRHAQAQYTVRLDQRDHARDYLAARGIATAVHYPVPVYRQPALAGQVPEDFCLPVTEQTCDRCLSLPLYQGLSEAQQQHVAATLREALL